MITHPLSYNLTDIHVCVHVYIHTRGVQTSPQLVFKNMFIVTRHTVFNQTSCICICSPLDGGISSHMRKVSTFIVDPSHRDLLPPLWVKLSNLNLIEKSLDTTDFYSTC